MSHTPRPWIVSAVRLDDKIAIISSENVICEVKTSWSTRSTAESNSKLIASAPDLLESVETLLDVFEKGTETPDDLEGILSHARKVVAKAKGQFGNF